MPASPTTPLTLGLDYRPALVNREGIGRATRELVRALVALEDEQLVLELFGWTLAAARFDEQQLGLAQHPTAARLHRKRFPAKWTRTWLHLRGGADRAMGMPGGLFHHTQPARLPIGRARESTMIWDLIFLDEDGRPGGPWVETQTAKRMATAARRAADTSALLLTPTEFVRQDVIAKLGVEPERVVTVGLGCDHLLPPTPEHLPTRPPFVLTVARVDPRKNHLVMLAAFERAVRAGLPHHWLVVGPDGWRFNQFEAALAKSPARHRIVRTKHASEAELAGLFATADVFLFASRAEGFGLPPLEAMAAGLPVVAANTTCLPEVLGEAALLVDPDDDEALFEGLAKILCERDFRSQLVERGRTRAKTHSWERSARAHLAAWRALV